MSKKRKKQQQALAPARSAPAHKEGGDVISSAGWKTIAGGIAVLISGFVVLSFTDREGRNWASTLSPFLILGSYGIIAFGIFLPDRDSPPPGPAADKTPGTPLS